MDQYNSELCKQIHEELKEKFKVVFDKVEKLENRINWFYILAISTLVTMLINLLKDFLKG